MITCSASVGLDARKPKIRISCPQALAARQRQLGVAGRALNRLMTQAGPARIYALVSQL